MIYHNFKNKEVLYLECVKRCYLDIIDKVFSFKNQNGKALDLLRETLSIRQSYFEKNSYYKKIFFDSTLACPKLLIDEVKVLREPYEEELRKRYADIVEMMNLKAGIPKELMN